MSDINITRGDIIDAIKTLSQKSSGGPDEISANTSQTMQQEPRPPSPMLYKDSLKTDEIPIDLKRTIITPIYVHGWLQESSIELPSCSPYITLNKNTRKNNS